MLHNKDKKVAVLARKLNLIGLPAKVQVVNCHDNRYNPLNHQR